MNNVKELYELWLQKTAENESINSELTAIKGKDDDILDRFYRNLEFGTAGLRGVLGAGTNRMNTYTVGQATQGLADYLNENAKNPTVVIGHDSRINSDVFSEYSACVLAANGIKVYFFSTLIPTPFVSHAVMQLHADSGIVITASHNPSKYNGYKCFDPRGYQMTEEAAAAVYEKIQNTDIFADVKSMDFDEAVKQGLIEYVPESIYESFYAECLDRPIYPELIKNSDIKIIYSPLNGTGNIPVRTVLQRAGFKNIEIVKEQELPDGNFPTCPFPNPEIRQVFEKALEMTNTFKADLTLATAPDCDRVGIAVKTGEEYKLLTGNEVGALLFNYILSQKQEKGVLPENPVVVKSFVSTKLADMVAAKYGATLIDVLTGFKYIGEQIGILEAKNQKERFVMGFEESYGYLIGTHAKDKDAVAASLMICEMAAYYKSKGLTLVDVINSLYDEFGFYSNKQVSYMFEGADGMAKMAEIMSDTAENTPAEIAGMKVLVEYNYNTGKVTDFETGAVSDTGLPRSNVLAYKLPDGNFAIVRPSGTEPKIKVYVTGVAKQREEAEKIADSIADSMKIILKVG